MPLKAEFFQQLRKVHVVNDGAQNHSVLLYTFIMQREVDALNAICAAYDKHALRNKDCIDELAYIMATCFRECGPELNLAIEEIGKGHGKAYGLPAGPYGQVYYGRGPTQETWLKNYMKAKEETGIDFVQFPQLMCVPDHGLLVMLNGMFKGTFTGHALSRYLSATHKASFATFYECRTIINGYDHAAEVALHAVVFRAALEVGYAKPVEPKPVPIPQLVSKTQLQPKLGFLASIAAFFRKEV